ncbi:hypothetical protein CK203_052282 [Vitis vinifera]|uniref:Retrotransposon gag domain-containing protein n=1 Tax=Vitis vinifera TaxID=29760 RepID=A0A438FWE4_VITVI|nr:hypothetical protein CK203_052282 [Vitis vinifera]
MQGRKLEEEIQQPTVSHGYEENHLRQPMDFAHHAKIRMPTTSEDDFSRDEWLCFTFLGVMEARKSYLEVTYQRLARGKLVHFHGWKSLALPSVGPAKTTELCILALGTFPGNPISKELEKELLPENMLPRGTISQEKNGVCEISQTPKRAAKLFRNTELSSQGCEVGFHLEVPSSLLAAWFVYRQKEKHLTVQKCCEITSQQKGDFATLCKMLPLARSDWLVMAATSTFQLRIAHRLKHWIVDFLSFEMLCMPYWIRDIEGRLVKIETPRETKLEVCLNIMDVPPEDYNRQHGQEDNFNSYRSMRDHMHPPRISAPSCIVPPTEQLVIQPHIVPLLPTFHGMESENPYSHIKEFEEDKAKIWLNSLRPRTKENEKFYECWERYMEAINACPHHGFDTWLLVSYFYDVSRGWDEPNAREMARMKSRPNAKGGIYVLNEDIDMKAKVAAMARRLEELEMKKVQEVQAISETSVQAMPCSICQPYKHLVEDCPTIPIVREMFGDQANVIGQFKPNKNASYGNTYNSNWKNHPNFSWKPKPPQYTQPAQAP